MRNCKYIGGDPNLKGCTALCQYDENGNFTIQLTQILSGNYRYLSYHWHPVCESSWKVFPIKPLKD